MKQVRELLSDPNRWTKHYYARRADGKETDPLSPDAVSFCLLGACAKLGVDSTPLYDNLNVGVAEFNDKVTHEQVLAFLDEVINAGEG
jgi:hypothetical protein